MRDRAAGCELYRGVQRQAGRREAQLLDPAPVRAIEDHYATFAAVAVDPVRNEIVLQDENLFEIRVYNRLANTPRTAAMTEPKDPRGRQDRESNSTADCTSTRRRAISTRSITTRPTRWSCSARPPGERPADARAAHAARHLRLAVDEVTRRRST